MATLWLLGLAVRAKAWNGLLGKIVFFFVTKIHGGERFDKLFPGVPEGHFLNHQIVMFTFLKHHTYHSKSLNLGLVGVSGLVVYSGSFVFGETSEVSISYGSTIGGLYVSTLKTCKPVAGCCA